MKHDKWVHYHINNTRTQQMKPKLSILILLIGLLLSLPFIGCGIFMPEGEYKAPQLPKSELATVKIDTENGWLHRYNLIVFRINGKLALREKIGSYKGDSIDEILVAPGKHDMSMATIHNAFDGDARSTVQTTSRFSADVKAGGTYLLRDGGKLIDANTDKVVSKSKFFGGSLFDME